MEVEFADAGLMGFVSSSSSELHRYSNEQYVEMVTRALRPGRWFGLTCFKPEGGSGYSDDDVYERGSMGGGLGYTETRLREIWSGSLEIRVIRPMHKPI